MAHAATPNDDLIITIIDLRIFRSHLAAAESYMLKDKATAKKHLDSDLEAYMAARNAPKAAPAAAEAEAPAAMES